MNGDWTPSHMQGDEAGKMSRDQVRQAECWTPGKRMQVPQRRRYSWTAGPTSLSGHRGHRAVHATMILPLPGGSLGLQFIAELSSGKGKGKGVQPDLHLLSHLTALSPRQLWVLGPYQLLPL